MVPRSLKSSASGAGIIVRAVFSAYYIVIVLDALNRIVSVFNPCSNSRGYHFHFTDKETEAQSLN